MKKMSYILAIFGLLLVGGVFFFLIFKGITPGKTGANNSTNEEKPIVMEGDKIKLPEASKTGGMSLTEALMLRRSIRSYNNEPLSVAEVSQLLWSAQGITNERGFRTAPSAGATFPLEMYVMSNNVTGLEKGVYHYDPFSHTLEPVLMQDVSAELTRASLSQSMVSEAAVVLIFGAVFERTTQRYGERGERYVYNE
ncbi:MAG: SagB/ThcOx family dehydrogenase, partial [Bacteroidota bacterium]